MLSTEDGGARIMYAMKIRKGSRQMKKKNTTVANIITTYGIKQINILKSTLVIYIKRYQSGKVKDKLTKTKFDGVNCKRYTYIHTQIQLFYAFTMGHNYIMQCCNGNILRKKTIYLGSKGDHISSGFLLEDLERKRDETKTHSHGPI